MNLDDLDPVIYESIITLFKTLALKSTSMCKYLSNGLYLGGFNGHFTSDSGSYLKLYNEIRDIRSSISDICSKHDLKYDNLWYELMVRRDITHL